MGLKQFRELIRGWFMLAAASVGLLAGCLIMILVAPKEETIICPPFMDKTLQELRINVWYELGQGPEFTELDYEFAEACGFETITGPIEIQPPAPEEGEA